jgi:RNA polymerase sigma-70 factor (ECF subfamily)
VALSADDLAQLYDRHAEAILAFLVRRTWDPEVAVDILAETFAVALEGRHRFRGRDRDAAGPWLYGIARHVLADHFRRDGAQRRALARLGIERRPLTDGEYERIEELAGSSELRDRVSEELDALPVDQREAVRLRVIDEQRYETLARTLDISQDTARARVSRGLKALHAALDAATVQSPLDLQRSTDHA